MGKSITTKTLFEVWEVPKGKGAPKVFLGRVNSLGKANPIIDKAMSHRPDSKVEIRKVIIKTNKEDTVIQTI